MDIMEIIKQLAGNDDFKNLLGDNLKDLDPAQLTEMAGQLGIDLDNFAPEDLMQALETFQNMGDNPLTDLLGGLGGLFGGEK